MITNGIKFKNFNVKKNIEKLQKRIKFIVKENNSIIESLKVNYKDNFSSKKIKSFKKFKDFRIIGMGGSSLGAQAIYDFLSEKIKKKFVFINNLSSSNINKEKKKFVNLVVSKSGNTIETIINSNIHIKRKDKNIFITENKKNYLYLLAEKLKSEIIHHNNFIGGRYSVLSEVGMLPAELMGLNSKKFRQLNDLIKNKKYLNELVNNVSSILFFIKKKKYNSIIINYDENSTSFFSWYQQLVAESLGKNKKGLLPIISNMPKDNHSVMQLFLDGFSNNFFTFFFVHNKKSPKVINSSILSFQS